MAQFKISLIVPNNDMVFNDNAINQQETYLFNVITDYQDQQSEFKNNSNKNNILKTHSVAYTYNEKLSIHKNGQQELTFNMDDKVCIDEEWIENPFARILRTGVQIELQDKFKHRKLFTVNKIQYNFNNVSIAYQVSCQDSFTYQLNRQNNGYTLKNDETNEDFIGALNVDQWAEIIARDCYITYQYLPLWKGLYQDNSGVLHEYNAPGDEVENPVYLGVNTGNVDKIIKPIYDSNTYTDFYETFPFSASGVSANAALIAVAETIGLQLYIAEGLASFDENNPGAPIKYARYFFFGPTKNPDITGLTYSPLRDIQSFGLSFSGDSLTTVLNIKSTTWNNEEIGVFPIIPPFFNAFFMSNDWTKTIYYNGFFTDAVKGNNYGYTLKESVLLTYFDFRTPDEDHDYYWLIDTGDSSGDGFVYQGEHYWKAKILDVPWASYYNKIRFYWDDQTNITTCTTGPSDFKTINSLQSNNDICFAYIDEDHNDIQIFEQNEPITREISWTNSNNHWYLLIKRPDTTENTKELKLNTLFFTITRDYTNEELEFAQIAENCPWLENKIMDFSYFVRQGILSKYEYEGLMQWLLNNLRIINGQLMCLANAYYYALHERTKILSRIETDTDALGAIFYADVVEPYTKTGMISNNISNFTNTYHQLFESDNTNTQDNGLLSINTIISDRFNKFFSAEQRFLQHMYNFRKYFEDRNIFSAGAVSYLDDVKYVVTKGENVPDNYLISFDGAIKWEALTSSSEIIHSNGEDYIDAYVVSPVYRYKDGKYIEQKIPNPVNYKEFYIPNIVGGNLYDVGTNHHYNAANLYYLAYNKYRDFFGEPLKEKIIEVDKEINNRTEHLILVRLSRQEVIKIFLSQTYSSHDYYIRDTNLKVPFDWVRTNFDVIDSRLTFHSWPAVSVLKDLNPNLTIGDNNQEVPIGDDQIAAIAKKFGKSTAWELYKSMSPIDELYIYDYYISYTTKQENDKIDYNFKVLDEKGVPYEYINQRYYHKIKNTDNDEEDKEEVPFGSLYRKFYAVPFLSYEQNTSSILSNNQNDTSATFSVVKFYNNVMAATKNSKYFVHYEDYTAKGWAIAGGVLFSLLSYTIVPGAGLLCTIGGIVGAIVGGCHKYAHWGKKDDTTFDMSHYNGNKWTSLAYNQKRGKDGQTLGNTNARLKGDSHWVNYTQKEDSELTIRGLTTTWWNNTNPWYVRLDNEEQSNYKHYFNYYQDIVATYSQGALTHDNSKDAMDNYVGATYDQYYFDNTERILTAEDRREIAEYDDNINYNYDYYWIKNRYGRFCRKTDCINYKDTYVWVPVEFFQDGIRIGEDMPERFGAIKYYPLVELREEVNLLGVFTKEELEKMPTWEDYRIKLQNSAPGYNITFDSDSYAKLNIQSASVDISFYIVHLEPFEKLKVSNITKTLSTHNPNNFTISWKQADSKIYHYQTDCELKNSEIILQPIDNVVGSFYFVSEKDDSLIKVSDVADDSFDWTDTDIHWYAKNNIDSRTYTINQILGVDPSQSDYPYYYMSNTTLSAAEFRGAEQYITPDKFRLCLRTYHIDEDANLIIDDNIEYDDRSFIFDATVAEFTQSFFWNGYKFNITRKRINHYDIGNMSNGTFWYHFHNRLDLPLVVEKAMIIETQLTTDWMQAYTASHYCQWFIPEYWQIDAATSNNAWFSAIWQINQAGNAMLSNRLIPEVEIYSYQNKTTLDGVLFHYHPNIDEQCEKEEYEIDEVEILKNNPAILNNIQYIFEDISSENLGKFTVQKYATHTYYYRVGGGTEHKNLIRTLDSQQKVYKHYDGLYAMQLHLLLTKYHNIEAPAYERKLNEKLKLWQMLYTRYPGVFLENFYENKDARSSQQLLQMAQLAFKDYSSPEKNYNITVIDAASLNGYEGQELHVGDGILLNTSDYYDAVDETYRALNQYLFISDISYNLRQDTDISLTVNPIKYQDKLLQSIVKLIR